MKLISKERRGCRYWARLGVVGLAGGLVVFVIGYVLLVVSFQVHPMRSAVCCITPADGGFEYETVTLTGGDGIPLRGWYIPSQNGAAVILLHGFGANRVEMVHRAVMLARHGYGALLYDLRAHGESGGDSGTFGWREIDDVAAAVAFLQDRPDVDPNRIGLFGFSFGGQIALRSAAELEAIRGVVADGPGLAVVQDAPRLAHADEYGYVAAQWLVDRVMAVRLGVPIPAGVAGDVARIAPRPLLLIATGQDDIELRIARDYLEHAAAPRELWAIPEAGHGGGPAARPEEYEQRLAAFYDRALAGEQK